MKLHVISDLHFEVNPNCIVHFNKDEKADVLLICGDITSAYHAMSHAKEFASYQQLNKFKESVLPNYDRVLYVLGNHDYYRLSFTDQPKNVIKSFFKDTNLTVLDNESYEYKGIKFFGSTLWTDFNKRNPIDMEEVRRGLNDYYVIDEISVDRVYQKHRESITLLQEFLNKNRNDDILVMSHHAPSLSCVDEKYKTSTCNAGFASNLDDLMLNHPNIKLWAYGHTHGSKDFMIGATRIYSNQCGYHFEQSYKNFNPYKEIHI